MLRLANDLRDRVPVSKPEKILGLLQVATTAVSRSLVVKVEQLHAYLHREKGGKVSMYKQGNKCTNVRQMYLQEKGLGPVGCLTCVDDVYSFVQWSCYPTGNLQVMTNRPITRSKIHWPQCQVYRFLLPFPQGRVVTIRMLVFHSDSRSNNALIIVSVRISGHVGASTTSTSLQGEMAFYDILVEAFWRYEVVISIGGCELWTVQVVNEATQTIHGQADILICLPGNKPGCSAFAVWISLVQMSPPRRKPFPCCDQFCQTLIIRSP